MGRGWPAPGEPLFTDEDQAAALVWLEAEWDRCPGCGGSMTETTDRDTQGKWSAVPTRCFSCQTREHAAHDFVESGDPAGLLWHMEVDRGD